MKPISGPLLIVSPHPDDVALSCAALLDRGEPVDVLTVFAGSPDPPVQGYWDARCGFEDSTEALRVRRTEELAALRPGGHRVTFLELLESQYFEGEREPADATAIGRAVAGWTGGLVAAPLGAGRRPGPLGDILGRIAPGRFGIPPHPEHLFVRDAVLAATGAPVLLYEEFPYLRSGAGEREAARVSASLGRTAELLTLPVDRAAKARRIAAYTSQVPHLTSPGERLDRPEALPETERYWLLEAS